MPKTRRAREKLSVDKLRVQKRYDTALHLCSLFIGRGLKWGFWAFLVWQGRLSLDSFAGRTTETSIMMALGANATLGIAASWATTIMFAVWVFFERRLRKGTAERLTLRIKELELGLDRRRSSSLLTTRGDTRPEDQL